MGILEDFSKRKRAQKEAVPEFLYHGTSNQGADSIESGGVSMEASSKGYFGQGFYLAVDPMLAKTNYADMNDDEDEPGVVLQFKVKPDAKLLDLRDSDDWDSWVSSGLAKQVGQDGFANVAVAHGIDGLYDESFGGYVIYNPSVLEYVGRWQPEERTAQITDLENYSRFVEWVPIDVIEKYSPVDRSQPDMSLYTEEDWQALRDSVAQGWTSPLILTYFKNDNTAVLSEGNHRLQVAKQLGLTEVPVRVYRLSMTSAESSYSDEAQPVPGHPDAPDYVPADLKPSDIGLI